MTTEASTAPENGQATETTSNWLEQIPEDATYEAPGEDGATQQLKLREHPKLMEFKSPADVAKSYLEAQKLLGKKVNGLAPLKENATDEDKKAWDAEFRKVMGVPEKPEGYEIAVPDGMKITDPEMYSWFTKTAHELGQSPKQAQGWFDAWIKLFNENSSKLLKDAQDSRERSRDGLSKHFGGEKQLGEAAELSKRAFKHLAAEEGLDSDEARAFAEAYGDEPVFVRLFARLGKTIGDHKLREGSGGSGPEEKTPAQKLYPNNK